MSIQEIMNMVTSLNYDDMLLLNKQLTAYSFFLPQPPALVTMPEQDQEPLEQSLSTKIRLLADAVLDALGAGHTESVYHNAMKIGIQDYGLPFESERDLPITFRGRYVGTVRADVIIDHLLVIEFKVSTGTDTNVSDAEEQCRLYMKETGIGAGLVIVFPKRIGGKVIVREVS